jgi:two-component system, cell cycle sensor histidine kinase and response regulator CckA
MHDYEQLFQLTADAICDLTTDGQIRRVNQACRDMVCDALPEEGGSMFDIFDQPGRERLRVALDSLSESSPTGEIEGQVLGTNIWSSWQLTYLDHEEVIAVGRDISSHHETTAALADKTAFLHSIIDAEPECVKMVSASGDLIDMNRAGLKMVGAQEPEEVMGHSVYDLIAPEDRERFIDFNERVCRGEGGELSFDIVGLDGSRRSMETTAVPLPMTPGGELLHLAITRDVSQRRMLEHKLRQAQKMEAIGRLAGGVAHDFNNLLTAIIGFSELALQEAGTESVVAEDLNQIKATGERASRLTQKLLTFARQQPVRYEAISLADLTLSIQEMLERLIGENYVLEMQVDPDSPSVCADRGHLEQLLLNLVLNARDAADEGGRITVSVGQQDITPQRANELGCGPGNHLELLINDDGMGIPEDVLPHIFDPFFSTKATGSGTGLGLATCYGIVAQLNGYIGVQSEPGEGATFSILIPAVGASDCILQSSESSEPRSGEGGVVLVVEDEPIVRSAVARMLRSEGYMVYESGTPSDAIMMAERLESISLLVTDMTMPEMNGSALARQLRQQHPELPVLYITGYLLDDSDELSGQIESGEILKKPFTLHSLSLAVGRAIHRDRSRHVGANQSELAE